MIPQEIAQKITSKVQPEDLIESRKELNQLAEQGKMHLSDYPALRNLQVKVYAAGIRMKKERITRPAQLVEHFEEEENAKAIRTEQAISRLVMGGDSIYADVSYTDPETRQTTILKALFEEFAYSGKNNALLLGAAGCGKTYAAVAFVSSNASLRFTERREPNVNAAFIRAYTLSEYIQRKNWNALDEIRSKKWLIIDDLGIEGPGYKSSDFLGFFEDLFIERHERQRRTIITCNGTIEEVKTTFGDRFISRLRETGEVYSTTDPDMRTRKDK